MKTDIPLGQKSRGILMGNVIGGEAIGECSANSRIVSCLSC